MHVGPLIHARHGRHQHRLRLAEIESPKLADAAPEALVALRPPCLVCVCVCACEAWRMRVTPWNPCEHTTCDTHTPHKHPSPALNTHYPTPQRVHHKPAHIHNTHTPTHPQHSHECLSTSLTRPHTLMTRILIVHYLPPQVLIHTPTRIQNTHRNDPPHPSHTSPPTHSPPVSSLRKRSAGFHNTSTKAISST